MRYVKCPQCKGLGITYFAIEGDCDCKLCKGLKKVKKKVARNYEIC